MCKSPLELVLVYKLLFFLDPNWSHPHMVCFVWCVLGHINAQTLLIWFLLNSIVVSFTNIFRGNMILIKSDIFHIHMCTHFSAYVLHKSLNVSNKICWEKHTLHPMRGCQTWGWSSQGARSISFVLRNNVYLYTHVPRLHKSVMCVQEATSVCIWKCSYTYVDTTIWIFPHPETSSHLQPHTTVTNPAFV
jgi:hypothetical protein